MLDKQPSALLAPTKEAVEANLFETDDETISFRHDIIFEAVRATLPASVARSLDRRAATVLIASGALPLEVSTRLRRVQNSETNSQFRPSRRRQRPLT